MPLLLWIGLGFLACAPAHAQDGGSQPALAERFRREAPGRWQDYAEIASRFQGKTSWTLRRQPPSIAVETHVELKRNGPRQLIFMTYAKTGGGKSSKSIEVLGLNPVYSFVLGRGDKPASPWAVRQLVDAHGEELAKFTNSTAMFRSEADSAVDELVRTPRSSLAHLIKLPTFQVKRCRRVREGGEELVEVVFDCPHEFKPGGTPTQGGTLLLDPARLWCIRDYRLDTRAPDFRGTIHFKVLDMGSTGESIPVPKHALREVSGTSPDGRPIGQHWEFKYDLHLPETLPDDKEFTLSAFGLPEPAGLGKRPTPWYLWFAAAGLGCLAVVAFLRWRLRHEP